jgi:hypothetical protein
MFAFLLNPAEELNAAKSNLYALTGSYQDVHRNEVPKICWI